MTLHQIDEQANAVEIGLKTRKEKYNGARCPKCAHTVIRITQYVKSVRADCQCTKCGHKWEV